jgi:RimK family alpha-L-glutamate ligase
MLKGWLIYDEIGRVRNKWFIEHIIEVAHKYNLSVELKITEGDIPPSPLPDFAVVRTICPQINCYLQNHGVVTFNNFTTSKIANDKWQTYLLCRELNIPVMETTEFESANKNTLGYPVILKSVSGHGGAQVFMTKDESTLNEAAQKLQGNKCILQRPSSTLGKDMRVYCMGDEVVAGVLRQSDSDFRSNFSLGGRATLCEVSDEQRAIIQQLHTKLNYDFVGIDFIIDDGHWVLNEIEDVVGTRMLYECTPSDIVEKYICYIKDKLKA